MGSLIDEAPDQNAIIEWKTYKSYIDYDLKLGSVASLPSDVKFLYPAFPSQVMKRYSDYQVARYKKNLVSPDSELWVEMDNGSRLVSDVVYMHLSDIYVDHHGNYYRGHTEQMFPKRHEVIGHGLSEGRTLQPDHDSPFQKDYIASGTYGVPVDEFVNITDATPQEVVEAQQHRQDAIDSGFDLKDGELIFVQPEGVAIRCFLAGTEISMWDGTKKTIEEIHIDDLVVSYDDDGNLVPGRVTCTSVNQVMHILDLYGLMITPGHVTFCGDGEFAGQHVPVIDILRSDGALVEEGGSLVRAATGSPVGSFEDRQIWAVAGSKNGNKIEVTDKGLIRLGTRFLMTDGRDLSVLDMIEEMGATLNDAGMLVGKGSDTQCFVFHWEHTPMLPKPEDYVLQRSELTLNDIYSVNEWEAVGPQVPAPSLFGSANSLKIKM